MIATALLPQPVPDEIHIPFFFNDTATTEIYTLSLHDALPIWATVPPAALAGRRTFHRGSVPDTDRKSTRLNSSHANISYAVFCLKKKKTAEKFAVRRGSDRISTVMPSR